MVKEGYKQALKEKCSEFDQLEDWAPCVWNRWAPTKVNSFVWRLIQDRIPTLSNLKKRNIITQEEWSRCRLCEEDCEENAAHLFLSCRFASEVWQILLSWLKLKSNGADNLKESLINFNNSTQRKTQEIYRIFWHCTVWQIWLARNRVIFKGDKSSAAELIELVKYNS